MNKTLNPKPETLNKLKTQIFQTQNLCFGFYVLDFEFVSPACRQAGI